MVKLRIIFLLLSSSLIFLSACSYRKYANAKSLRTEITSTTNLVSVINLNGQSSKYKASIDVLNKHFTGIIVLKQTDSITKHMVFVTELGMRMFDFVIRGDSVKADFVFDALNKPAFVKALTINFRDILLISAINKTSEIKSYKSNQFYWLKDRDNSIAVWKDDSNFAKQLIVFAGHKKHAYITYQNNYSLIKFNQFGLIKIRIELNRITESNT